MLTILLRLFGERFVHHAAAKQGRNPLDVKFGVAMARDRRVPFKCKLLAVGLGVSLLALLLALEVPLEAFVTFLAPFLLPVDMIVDGLEIVALPILFSALLLPFVAPRALVEQLRAERSLLHGGPIIDIQPVASEAGHGYVQAQHLPQSNSPANQTLFAGSRP